MATVPALPLPYASQIAGSINGAIKLYFEVVGTDPELLDFVGVQRVTVEV